LSFTLREEHRLRVLENRVTRRIYGTKREEGMRGLRRLHSEELHNIYCSPIIIRMIKSRRTSLTGHVARMRDEKRTQYFGRKAEGKIPFRILGHICEDNIRMALMEVG
jgi:hypothetical protein